MPVLQNLYIQRAFIKNLFGTEEGFLGGMERCGERERQRYQQWVFIIKCSNRFDLPAAYLFKKLKFVCAEREVAVVKRIGIEGMDFFTPGVSAFVKDEVVLNIQGNQEAA